MNYDEMMAELRRDYLASIPTKVHEIRVLSDSRDGERLRDAFHKLKGTGKTYGIPEISELGECMEKLCLSNPDLAITTSAQAAALLEKIRQSRNDNNKPFSLASAPEYQAIAKVLPG